MGVQTKILKRDLFTDTVKGKSFTSATGAQALGVPGDVADLAFGPVAHTTTLAADATYGEFVEGQGVLISPRETARVAVAAGQTPLSPSMVLLAGQVGTFMTAGHVVMKYTSAMALVEGDGAKMTGSIIKWEGYGNDTLSDSDDSDDSDGDTEKDGLCVVEVLGLK